jgi:methyltransferase type 11
MVRDSIAKLRSITGWAIARNGEFLKGTSAGVIYFPYTCSGKVKSSHMGNRADIQHFYDTIAEKYDAIFPLSGVQRAFFDGELGGMHRVLDVGAATGNLAAYLRGKGLEVTAIDLSDSLIAKAGEKGVEVLRRDMLTIGELPGGYDAIVNIGNTLPHLGSLDEVASFLRQAYGRLRPGGKLIVQMVNFSRYLAQRKGDYLGDLPLIDKPGVRFERSYYLKDEGTIRFRAVLDGRYSAEEELIVITHRDLSSMLAAAGFGRVRLYGNFQGEAYDERGSMALVGVGERG